MGSKLETTGQLRTIDFKTTPGYYLHRISLKCNYCNWEEGSGISVTNPRAFYWIMTARSWHCCDGCCYPRDTPEPAMHQDWEVKLTFDKDPYPAPPKFACKFPFGKYFD